MEWLKKLRNELGGNFDAIAEQWAAYQHEIETVIKPGIKNSDEVADAKGRNRTLYKLHKYSAYGEEFFDINSRIVWYWFCFKTAFIRPFAWYLMGLGLLSLLA